VAGRAALAAAPTSTCETINLRLPRWRYAAIRAGGVPVVVPRRDAERRPRPRRVPGPHRPRPPAALRRVAIRRCAAPGSCSPTTLRSSGLPVRLAEAFPAPRRRTRRHGGKLATCWPRCASTTTPGHAGPVLAEGGAAHGPRPRPVRRPEGCGGGSLARGAYYETLQPGTDPARRREIGRQLREYCR